MMEPPSIGTPANQAVDARDAPGDLRRVLRVVRAHLPALIAIPLLAAGVTFYLSEQQPKVYEAQATLIVGQSLSAVNPEYSQLLASQRLTTTYAGVATTGPVLEGVIRRLGLAETSAELSRRVRAQAAVDSTLVSVIAEDVDPGRASAIANAIAEELIAASPAVQGRQAEVQQSVDEDLDATQDQIRRTQERVASLIGLSRRTPRQEDELRTLQAQLVSLRATYADLLPFSSSTSSNQVSVIQPAVASSIPISPRPLLNSMLAAAIALLITAGVVYLANHLDDTVKGSEDVLEVAGLPTLGRIAQLKGPRGRFDLRRSGPLLASRPVEIEAYRTLRTNIGFTGSREPIRTLLVTSTEAAAGKTVTAANLAIVFAQAGGRVLLVDTNLRQPGIHRLFGLPNEDGLTTILADDGANLGRIAQETGQEHLRVVTSGPLPPDPAGSLGSNAMRTIVERFGNDHDLIIFDSPPLQPVTDAAILASFLDATLLVVHTGRTRRDALRRAREALGMAGARVVGVVLNRVPKGAYADSYDLWPQYGANRTPTAPPEVVAPGTQTAERSGP